MSGVELLLIALGGAFGAVARALIDQAAARAGWLAEYGTLTINLIGSLLAGLIVTLIIERSMVSLELRPLLITGLLGGFTTFSALSMQLSRLIAAGDAVGAAIYAVGSVALGAICALLGAAIGRAL
ncbi:MAG: CrcB family protein [Chloroflexi bacterium]|nr:MAG: CrcB family protein [Chloroflexota bacterium]RLT27940.1 MAG: CrcB family protein [Chloroflexota bacterium]